ncbi:hypothetical protein [uncultured Pseudacidovorax sp.]|uniref:hypothetical protein n=1 Tax=uncultured Pseudacidovorax sp. TaxID=679313 RepID=UPI0025DC95D7|nr:hypothetical protein [uncultured Pseudacidovorax sp.]
MNSTRTAALLALALGAPLVVPAQTQTTTTQLERTQVTGTQSRDSARQSTALDAHDRLLAEIWGLTDEEMTRAKVLLQGPRAAFSVPNLSPVEALGIHARTDAERRRYAEMMAKAVYADVQRSLAWDAAYQQAITRLVGNSPIVSFDGLPKVSAPTGSADAAGVPRTLVLDPSAPAARGPSSRAMGQR